MTAGWVLCKLCFDEFINILCFYEHFLKRKIFKRGSVFKKFPFVQKEAVFW